MRIAGVALVLLAACATIPPPDVLGELDQVRQAPAAAEAREHAPDAYAQAEKLRAQAQAAYEEGDVAGAQILGEHAIAAFQEAVAVARAAKAAHGRLEAKKEADAAETRLAELDREHQEVASDIAALEKRLEVLDQLELPAPAGPASAAREKARSEAARALNVQARLLCAAAELLAATPQSASPPPSALTEAKAKLVALEARLEGEGGGAAPIDEAMRARAGCLEALTQVRRARNDQTRAPGRGDELLTDLTKLGIGKPGRDDRGVVLSMRDLFADKGLATSSEAALAQVVRVAAKHPQVPLLVVLHQQKEGAQALWTARGEALVARLRRDLGEGRVGAPQLAGVGAPIVAPEGSYAAQNERVDLVFITPESL